MRHALITGGAGFIGLHLARRLLADGWHVDLVDNFSRGRRDADLEELVGNGNIDLIEADLLGRDAAASFHRHYTHIFHFAAILGVQTVIDRPYDVLSANVALTEAAIEISRLQTGLQRLMFASTSEVYAGVLEHFDLQIPTPESTPLALSPLARPRTSYMLSKIYGEALCLHSNLPVTMIRPHNVYGPRMGQSHVIPQLLERGYRTVEDGVLEVYSAEHTRTFCFVDDAVEMIVRLVAAEAAIGQTVNVGTEAPEVSIGRLAEIVVAVLGKRLTMEPRPPTQGSPSRRAPDMSQCVVLSGYRSLIGLEEGVSRTFSWYRRHTFNA